MYILPTLPCALPTGVIPEFIDVAALSDHFIKVLEVLGEDDFTPDAIWRDSFALTGTVRTFYSAASVMEAWKNTAKTHNPTKFGNFGHPRVFRTPYAAWVDMSFTFETTGTPETTCSGFLSVVPTKTGQWKIWVIRTILEQIKGQPSVDVYEPVGEIADKPSLNGTNGVTDTTVVGSTNGENGTNGVADTSALQSSNGTNGAHSVKKDFECVIIGGGQAGLSTAGRLAALGVSYVILEAFAEVGDNWKTRYDSTKLHTIREFAHLPFDRTFSEGAYPEFLDKDMLARGYKDWVKKYNINIWCSTSFQSGSWDAGTETWTLNILRNGQKSSITCSYIVFAAGAGSQVPVMPTYEHQEVFKGISLHSGTYKSSSEWTGKHGVIIGTANTAHDIADDMLAAGLASVTMVQRSPTFVVPAEHYKETHDKVYNAQIPTEFADRMYFSGPAALGRIMSGLVLNSKADQEPERFDSLERAGFLLQRKGDMIYQIFERFGGHYMDVGTSAKISSGQIKMKSDSLPVSWVEDGLLCANGDHLRADVVVFATGFLGNMRLLVAELFGHEVASQVEDFWGLDEEGEIKGAFKPSGHPAFWYHGGAVGQARYFARFIALQIKAKVLGTPLPVYNGTRRTEKSIL